MNDYELCLRCVKLRGQTDLGWQGCRCMPGPRWEGCDVSEEHALCTLCARGLAGGPSRWSSLACPPCRDWEQAVRARLGGFLLPLERHSIANGVAVDLAAVPEVVDRQTLALLGQFTGWDELYAWKRKEARRLAKGIGLRADAVPYREWVELFPVSSEASCDAYLRLRKVDPSWVVSTFPILKRPRPQPVDPWIPADVGQPAVGETLEIASGSDGHDLTITARESGLFMAVCLKPGCGWAFWSAAFPPVRWQTNRHATGGTKA